MNLKATAVLETLPLPRIESVRDLRKDETLSLSLKKGKVSLYCLSGCLWASLEGRHEDILVQAGETRDLEGRGRLVISALDHSRMWIG